MRIANKDQVCRNCGNAAEGKYCNNCGQPYNVPQFTYKHIVEEVFHAFTHADKSLLTYIRKLCINPGHLAYEYIIQRKRKKYFNPFTFFVLVSAISAFITSKELHIKEDLFHPHNSYGHLFNVYSKALSLVTIPIIALVLWLIHFKRPRYLYTEYVVFAMLLVSLYTLIEGTASLINYLAAAFFHKNISIQDSLVYLGAFVIYTGYADFRFQTLVSRGVLKSILAGVFFVAMLIAIQVFIVFAYINHFQGVGTFYIFGIHI